MFKAILKFDINCTCNNGTVARAFTIISDDISFKGELEIDKNFYVKLKNLDFKLKFKDTENSVIGDINLSFLNALISLGEGIFINLIRAFFLFGFPLGALLKFLNADVINLDKISLLPYEEYFAILLTPKFNFEKMKGIIIQWILRLLGL